ncbi:ABC transporter permease [Foetidibacter luteolus]|uniref:ABC transporter permease n=1 Tax=Foetidibacter luteolus TaxID=2608880 RepID=UPI00129B1FC9|nr:ABC transporter permease [Foetidibacter luteolus]
MFKNYIKIAWRNLRKNKTFSIINIAGLAIGLSCFLLIALYVMDELSFDRHYKNASRIYRVNSDIRFGGANLHMPLSSDMMGQLLKKDYPQIEEYTRVYTFNGSKLVKKGNDFITENRVGHVDSTFFKVFSLPSLQGNVHTALNEPNTTILTASAAQKYFGSTQVLGKTLELQEDGKVVPYKVNAVIEDMPDNSHFKFDMLFSMKNVDYQWGQHTSHNFYTYLLMKDENGYKQVQAKFGEYIEKYVMPMARQYMNVQSMDEFQKAGNKLEYSLMPLTDIHLHSDRQFELRPAGNIQYVYIFSAVAVFILLIACINFMNLTTARSANRAREVGIRKVLGTERKELVTQFLIESTLMVVLSLVIALAIDYSVLDLFNNVADKKMTLGSLFSPYILPLLVALPFVTGLLAGSYPAFYLSAFKPIEVLKGKLKLGSKSGGLRSVLVVFQFATSIILIIGTIVVYRQLHYIQNQNLGFDKDQVLVVDGTGVLGNNVKAFKNDVLKMQGVQSGTISAFLPVSNSSRNDNTFSKTPVMDVANGFDMQNWRVDYDYIRTMGMNIIKGRNFSPDYGADSSAIIINETTAQILGYADPLGKQVYYASGGDGENKAYTIIGVVKNFNFETIHHTVGPLGLFLGESPWTVSFKVNAGNVQNLVSQVQNKWKAMAPGMPFSYRFLNESFDEMYRAEQRVGTIAMIFSVLAIVIACLGLFGLATFIAEQRTKEIGIRKVLGASVNGIVQMLSKDFMKLVAISFVLASPLAWWAMNKWLQDFAFRISISWWIFAVAGGAALLIALLTVSFQAIRAALMNPVKSLRTE